MLELSATDQDGRWLRVGGLCRTDLMTALTTSGIQLNVSARTLLADAVFDSLMVEEMEIVERTVADLGLSDGASLSTVVSAAQNDGLLLCPPVTGPYLRLATLGQQSSPDAVMSGGRAPAGSVTIASPALREDDAYPKGFYLRVVGDVPWLRGYRCTQQHGWSGRDRFAFRREGPGARS